MKTFSEKEIEYIEAENWDKGWRWGLFAATIFWIVIGIMVMVLSN